MNGPVNPVNPVNPHNLVEDYRSFLAANIRDQLTLYSAEQDFVDLAAELGRVTGVDTSIAAELLYPVIEGIRDAIDDVIPNLIR